MKTNTAKDNKKRIAAGVVGGSFGAGSVGMYGAGSAIVAEGAVAEGAVIGIGINGAVSIIFSAMGISIIIGGVIIGIISYKSFKYFMMKKKLKA